MALSLLLTEAGYTPLRIKTSAAVHIEPSDDGFTITRIDLVTEGDVPKLEAEAFSNYSEAARSGCPVSKALAGVEITLRANLTVTEFAR
jgi:osmotically inducible protein OsmC